jgi:hypothetical protein
VPNTTPIKAQKNQEVMNSQENLITIKENFLDIGKKMFKIIYIFNLGQLLKITYGLKM